MDFLEGLGQWKLPFMWASSVFFVLMLASFIWWICHRPKCKCVTRFSEDVEAILDALKRHKEWKIGTHRLTHKSGLEFWIANEYYGFEMYEPTKKKFPEPAKRHIYNAFEMLRKKKIVQMLEDS